MNTSELFVKSFENALLVMTWIEQVMTKFSSRIYVLLALVCSVDRESGIV